MECMFLLGGFAVLIPLINPGDRDVPIVEAKSVRDDGKNTKVCPERL